MLGFNAGVLSRDPLAIFGFECLFAGGAVRFVVLGLQGHVLLDREDDRVDLARLVDEHGPALGLRAEAAKTILGFGGSYAHVGSPPVIGYFG